MPSGRTHADAAWGLFVTTIGVSAVTLAAVGPGDAALNLGLFGLNVGAYVGIFVTPDLDVDGGNISYKFVRKKFGRAGHWGWKTYWRDYARRHRHRGTSHKLVIGTAGRWLYVLLRGGWLVWLSLLVSMVFLGVIELLPYVFWFTGWAFLGNVLQDGAHAFLDRWF